MKKTDDGVHLSNPVAPEAIPFCKDLNLKYDMEQTQIEM
jgi:hypothetical protein